MLKVRFTKPYDLAGHKEGDELVLKGHSKVPHHLADMVEVIESDSDDSDKTKEKEKAKRR